MRWFVISHHITLVVQHACRIELVFGVLGQEEFDHLTAFQQAAAVGFDAAIDAAAAIFQMTPGGAYGQSAFCLVDQEVSKVEPGFDANDARIGAGHPQRTFVFAWRTQAVGRPHFTTDGWLRSTRAGIPAAFVTSGVRARTIIPARPPLWLAVIAATVTASGCRRAFIPAWPFPAALIPFAALIALASLVVMGAFSWWTVASVA